MRIWDLPTTERDTILFFQERNILPKERKCTNFHDMKLYFGECKTVSVISKWDLEKTTDLSQAEFHFVQL